MTRNDANRVSAPDDTVRRAAYEQAMSILRQRVSLVQTMTDEDQRVLAEYDGPEVSGRAGRIRRSVDR